MCNRGFPHNDWVNKNDFRIFLSDDNANLANHITGNSDSFEISYDCITCEEYSDPNVILDNLRKKNFGRLTIGHLNINSLRDKFEASKSLIQGKVDIFVVSKTKLDESFPQSQFAIDGLLSHFD